MANGDGGYHLLNTHTLCSGKDYAALDMIINKLDSGAKRLHRL